MVVVPTRHMTRGNEENYEGLSQPRFEISTSRIQAHSVATIPIYSVDCVELYLYSTMHLHSATFIKHRINFTSTFYLFRH